MLLFAADLFLTYKTKKNESRIVTSRSCVQMLNRFVGKCNFHGLKSLRNNLIFSLVFASVVLFFSFPEIISFYKMNRRQFRLVVTVQIAVVYQQCLISDRSVLIPSISNSKNSFTVVDCQHYRCFSFSNFCHLFSN